MRGGDACGAGELAMATRDELVKVWRPVAETVHPADELLRQQRVGAAVGNDGKVRAESISLMPAVTASWHLSGTVATGNSQGMRWMPPQKVRIERVQLSAGTAPTGAALNVRFKVNGSTFATASLPISNSKATASASGDAGSNDVITLDVTQVGSTVAGSNLTVHLVYRPVME